MLRSSAANLDHIQLSSGESQTHFTMSTAFRPEQAYVTPPNSHPDQDKPLQQTPGPTTQISHFSPTATASQSPMNASPSSPNNESIFPHLPLKGKNLKSPLYIPAVLRPTERPYRSTPLTPPRSMQGSTDSLDNRAEPRPTSRHSMSSFRKRSQHLRQVSEDTAVPIDDLQPVNGPPTHDHWKPDPDAVICDAPICRKTFNLFERRHHCRHCGLIFCNTHSAYSIPLDQNADFHPKGLQSRACGSCWGQYATWRDERISRQNSFEHGEMQPVEVPMARGKREDEEQERPKMMANSIPDAFQFSTF